MMDERAITRAFHQGETAVMFKKALRDNPYMPISEEELWAAWDQGHWWAREGKRMARAAMR